MEGNSVCVCLCECECDSECECVCVCVCERESERRRNKLQPSFSLPQLSQTILQSMLPYKAVPSSHSVSQFRPYTIW